MQSTIKLRGNQRDGYTLTVSLPQDWLNWFTRRMGVPVCGEPLCGTWGQSIEGEQSRVRKVFPSSIEKADFLIDDIRGDIKAAKTALANIKDIEKTVVVDL